MGPKASPLAHRLASCKRCDGMTYSSSSSSMTWTKRGRLTICRMAERSCSGPVNLSQ